MFLRRAIEGVLFNFIIVATCVAQTSPAQPDVLKVDIELQVEASLPKILKEASGLEMTASGILWTHNDEGIPVLYGVDHQGNVVRTVHLNHSNKGWEDVSLDKNGTLYIGAFGNNNNDRQDLAVLKISDPEHLTDPVVNAEVIHFEYADQHHFPPPESKRNFDADALVSIGDSLYIITKNRTKPFTGYAHVYRLPTTPGKHKAVLHDSLFLGNGPMLENWVTGADISPDGKVLVLLSHNCLWIISNFKNQRFSTGKITRIPLDDFSHKAGICFVSPDKICIVDELEFGLLGGKLYSLDIRNILKTITQKTPTP